MKTEIKSIKLEEECEISGFIETTREQKTMLFVVKNRFFLQTISIHIPQFAANNNDRAADKARSMK